MSNSFLHTPVLESVFNKYNPDVDLEDTAIILVFHALLTYVNVFEYIIKSGIKPKNIYALCKSYSQCDEVVVAIKDLGVNFIDCTHQDTLCDYIKFFKYDVARLWKLVLNIDDEKIKNLIILDHGGHIINYLPPVLMDKYKVIGIEKTTSGIFKLKSVLDFPLINFAGSSAKKVLESPLIANSVVEKLTPFIPLESLDKTIGVAGYGAIGKAIVEKLNKLGFSNIIVYDKKFSRLKQDKNAIFVKDFSDFIIESEYIFGCSGYDITCEKDFMKNIFTDKVFISCSSEDKEFLSLIKYIAKKIPKQDVLKDIEYTTDKGHKLKILRGGFPINFDNTGLSVNHDDIQLTRALLLAAFFQAIEFLNNNNVMRYNLLYPVDKNKQLFVVDEWVNFKKKSNDKIAYLDLFYRKLNKEIEVFDHGDVLVNC